MKKNDKSKYITKKVKEQSENRDNLNKEIIDIYRKGGSTQDVEKYLISIGRKDIKGDINLANVLIKDIAKEERDILINTHVKRYEKIFEENISKTLDDFAYAKPHVARFLLIDSYFIAMEALVAKERVLGLHTKHFRVQLNNFFKKKIVKKYNFAQQDFNDLIRLKELLEKMKTTEREDFQVVQNIDLEEESNKVETIDAEFVEVNVENASKIKEVVKPNAKKSVTKESGDVLYSLREKLFNQDKKNHDPQRKSLLDKLNKISKNGKGNL